MSLHLLPRYSATSIAATRAAMLREEPTLTQEVRARALLTLRQAVATRRIEPSAVRAAVQAGDAGVASLLRQGASLPRPQVARSSLPTPQIGRPSSEVIKALHPWVRMLAAEGQLDAAALRSLADPSLTVAGLCRMLFGAWERLKQAVLTGQELPAALPEDMGCYLDVGPTLFDALLRAGHHEDDCGKPRLEIACRAVSFFALRATGDDYRALSGMLASLGGAMALPLIASPDHAIEEFFPWMDELFCDLENIVVWSEDGRANLPADETAQMLEQGFGFDPEDTECLADLQAHLEWRRLRKTAPSMVPGSDEAMAWLASAGDRPAAQVYRALDALRAGLGKRAKPMESEFTEGTFGVIGCYMPTACGIEDRVEGWVNEMLNSGEGESTLLVTLPAKPAQMGSAVRRVLTEVAAANYTAALIETL